MDSGCLLALNELYTVCLWRVRISGMSYHMHLRTVLIHLIRWLISLHYITLSKHSEVHTTKDLSSCCSSSSSWSWSIRRMLTKQQSSKYRRGFIYPPLLVLLPSHLLFIVRVCLSSQPIQVGKLRESKNQKNHKKKSSKKSISIFIFEVIAQIYWTIIVVWRITP